MNYILWVISTLLTPSSSSSLQTQALALTRSKSPAGKMVPTTTPPSNNGNGLADNNSTASNLSFSHNHHSNNNTSGSNQNHSNNNCRDDRASMVTTSPKSTTSSNHSTRADFSGRESNGHGPSPSSASSPRNLMNRDRSRSPQSLKSGHPGNGALALNIKEEENESSPIKEASALGSANANLLAANYFANNHLKLAENLMSHGGANFLQANLLQANKGMSNHNNDIRTSPEKNNDDDGGTATPLSTHAHHPMGGFERKDFDFSKVNGEWGSL